MGGIEGLIGDVLSELLKEAGKDAAKALIALVGISV